MKRRFRKPTKLKAEPQPQEDQRDSSPSTDVTSSEQSSDQIGTQELIQKIQDAFSYPTNKDLVVRELFVRTLQRNATLICLAGMADMNKIETKILAPLLETDIEAQGEDTGTVLIQRVLALSNITCVAGAEPIIDQILAGNALLIIDDCPDVLSIAVTGYEHRTVDKPQSETILKGPIEAFVESGEINRSLIRKQLRSSDLIAESMVVGKQGLSEVTLMYLGNIAAPELVEDVKKRIDVIEVDTIQTLGELEQHIEDRPYSLVPTVLFTERPDRAAAFLREGHVIMLMDSSPMCLIVPVTFWSFFHTPEDYYQRWAYGNFIRLIRLAALFVALLTPSIYIAVTNYHMEMLPTDLLLAIAATRERVPFPAIVEVLIMEAAFELLREAGVRIPTPIGPTIGIVGALILGQAAVDANVVSPILVIVVAITGLASFAIPNISFNFMIRISRFLMLLFSAFMGFYGVTILLAASIAYLSTVKSFDVPFLAPKAPRYRASADFIYRAPLWKMWLRPQHLRPQESVRQPKPEGGDGQ